MWLLHTTTLELREFSDPTQVHYAILSHVWNTQGPEATYQDVKQIHSAVIRDLGDDPSHDHVQEYLSSRSTLPSKIRDFVAVARSKGYEYVWIDTCCIDKTSSAELSEAINSMFQWYAQASVCYVYLHDVDGSEHPAAPNSAFRASRWFTRGWTLQELVAPRYVAFFSRDWTLLGTKDSLANVIEAVTHISTTVLTHGVALNSVSIAERMSWAAERTTTRIEDRAYSLLGIFGIHLPTIYGEGHQSFIRLQEEILRRIPDQTLFAWGRVLRCPTDELHRLATVQFESRQDNPLQLDDSCLLAPSPTYFRDSAQYSPLPLRSLSQKIGSPLEIPQYTTTSYGIRTTLPICFVSLGNYGDGSMGDVLILAILACCSSEGALLSIILSPAGEPDRYFAGTGVHQITFDSAFTIPLEASIHDRAFHPRMMLLDESFLLRRFIASPIEVRTIFILHSHMTMLRVHEKKRRTDGFRSADRCEIILPPWTRSHLQGLGFECSFNDDVHQEPAWDRSITFSPTKGYHLTLLCPKVILHIRVYLCPLIDPESYANPWALHVVVTLTTASRTQMERSGMSSRIDISDGRIGAEGCGRPECHVHQWEAGSKLFYDMVRLTFANWRSVRGGARMLNTGSSFALDIEIKKEAAAIRDPSSPSPHVNIPAASSPAGNSNADALRRRKARQVRFHESVRVELYERGSDKKPSAPPQ
ncbi:heterokaryon incompatibility protein-domain-containing protein [Dichomitus squalens]|uniref:Heterokaryon incompatibility protein-domain-containing protein n=1 Tax=Dichomitus squalens TaxID=114155 RepID=A0A4Q9PN25_9APHY|nr:heterokaryon incompatibility protein-domain-containing protein [Dichomitus squalens]